MNDRVLVAMSGGVDSSVAALLLRKQGYQVVGVTMQLWHDKGASKSCCSHTDITDARLVADRLGIPHYVFDYEQDFKTTVVDYFASEYQRGKTPNPCVMCNSRLKFSHLIAKADALSATWVATGHYAGINNDGKQLALVQARDKDKDQSYFLFNLRNEELARIKFPLANLSKDEVRAIARENGLVNADKAESQDLCFVGGRDYRDFIQRNYQVSNKVGCLKTADGRVVGQHDGIHRYTVGQRKGLGVALGKRQYVTAIDPLKGEVTLGGYDDLVVETFRVDRVRWLDEPQAEGLEVMSRYRAPRVACRVDKSADGCWQVASQQRVLASPGQAAVFFRGEQVVGGGFIVAG